MPNIELVDKLNDRFRAGTYVWHRDIRRLLGRVSRPICVDLDNTLVTYEHDYHIGKLGFIDSKGVIDDRNYKTTPDAVEALANLRGIGSVVILTANNSAYARRQEWLEELGLWQPGTIMIDAWNYRADLSLQKRGFIFPQANGYVRRMNQERTRIIDEYLERRGLREDMFEGHRWSHRIIPKALAAAFDKPYDIPIIDDDQFNTQFVPGMFGLLLRGDLHTKYFDDQTGELLETNPSITLLQAVEQVKSYYSNIT